MRRRPVGVSARADCSGANAKRERTGTVRRVPQRIDERHRALGTSRAEKFTSLGRWRSRKEVGDREADVFIPWIIFDLDGGFKNAHRDAEALVRYAMEETRIDPGLIYVGFSGSKGFHVHLSTGALGFPVFTSAISARETIGRVMDRLARAKIGPAEHEPVRYDEAVAGNPRSMVRLEGSYHAGTGARKEVWSAPEFLSMDLRETVEAIRSGEWERSRRVAFDGMSRVVGPVREILLDVVGSVREAVERERRQSMSSGSAENKGFGSVLRSLIGGVAQSEPFEGGHAGRSRAAYILACCCLESAGIRREAARRLGLSEDESAEKIVRAWNRRNEPPLRESELDLALRSARKKIRPGQT